MKNTKTSYAAVLFCLFSTLFLFANCNQGVLVEKSSLNISIPGINAARSASPNLTWTEIALKVWINNKIVYDKTIFPSQPAITIEEVEVGSTAYAEAVITLEQGDSRTAVSDTVTIQENTTQLNMYVPYNITWAISSSDRGTFSDGTTTQKEAVYTTNKIDVPTISAYTDSKGYVFTGWNTESDGTGETFIPGTSTGDYYVYAQFSKDETLIVYSIENYTSTSSFLLYTPAQLNQIQTISKSYDFASKTVTLANSISADSSFTGLSSNALPFAGTFDGAGYTITLNILNASVDDCAFVINLSGTIQDLTIAGSIQGGTSTCAGFVCYNTGTITKCCNEATIIGLGMNTGGIVSKNNPNGVIEYTYNLGAISSNFTSETHVGGICGYDYYNIQHVYNRGTVTATAASRAICGGICGCAGSANTNEIIEYCYTINTDYLISSITSSTTTTLTGIYTDNSCIQTINGGSVNKTGNIEAAKTTLPSDFSEIWKVNADGNLVLIGVGAEGK